MNQVVYLLVLLSGFPTPLPQSPDEPPRLTRPDPFDQSAGILPQPFDKGPFYPVRIPGWVRETTGAGYTLSGMDTAARTRAAAHGVRLSEVNFVDPFYPYYDSKLLKRRSPHVGLDRLPREIAEYKKLGVRVLAVYPPTLQGEVYEAHPEWRRIDTNTTKIPTIDLKKFPHGGMLCPLGPYGDFFIGILAEILTQFPEVDAFSFDGLHHGGVCYCEHCRKNYRADTGSEIPPLNMEDPKFRRYQHWADRKLEDLVRRMQARLKGIKPDVALVTWSTNAGRFGHFLSIPRNMPARMNLLFDAPDQELWLDESNRGNSIVPALGCAYVWAVSNHRVGFSEPYLLSHGNPYGKDSFPAHEIERRMMLAVTHGSVPSIAVAQPPRLQQPLYAIMDRIQKRKPWILNRSPMPHVAMLLSDNTRNFYGRSAGAVEERYLAHVLGAFRALVEEHIPVTLINDWNLNDRDLSDYAAIVLPNAACLDEAQARSIRNFAKKGRGVIASCDTGLFDEFGDPRANFLLSDLLGVDFRGRVDAPPPAAGIDVNFAKSIGPDYWAKRKNILDFTSKPGIAGWPGRNLDALIGSDPVTFKGPANRVSIRPGTRVLGTFRPKDDPGVLESPAIVASESGKVIYLAGGFDSAYYLYPYPYQRKILTTAIERVASGPPKVQVEAPMCVHAGYFVQDSPRGKQVLVHLFNNLNTTGNHARPEEDVPLREEAVPIRDIRVNLNNAPGGRITWQPEGRELKRQKDSRGEFVTVDKLDVHGIVVIEP